MHSSRARSNNVQDDELIELGYNWFIHNPNHRAVRVRYEAIGPNHPALPAAEIALSRIAHSLLQISGCRATIVPCLHREALQAGGKRRGTPTTPTTPTMGIVLHATLLNVEVLEMVHMMQSAVPVHLYIGEPLTTATSFDMYSPDKVTVPERLDPGDPLFSQSTQRALTFGAYLHAVDDEDALFGLTAGQAVVPHAGFALHPRLKPRERHQKRVRSSQAAVQCVGRPLSNPAVKVVEEAIRVFQREKERMHAELRRTIPENAVIAIQRRIQQQEAEYQRLLDSLARPQEYDVGHACAAEALIRPCSSAEHHKHPSPSQLHLSPTHSHRPKSTGDDHTHLLSWTLMRMAHKATDNPITMHTLPGALERGASVSMHVRDPNVERPLGPYRDGVVNGAPASVIIGGYIAREWAVFPASDTKSIRFATRGDAGAIITSAREGDVEGGGIAVPLAMLYAAPERGPYGLVTPLTTILRRIRDVTGLQLRFQGSWWRERYASNRR